MRFSYTECPLFHNFQPYKLAGLPTECGNSVGSRHPMQVQGIWLQGGHNPACWRYVEGKARFFELICHMSSFQDTYLHCQRQVSPAVANGTIVDVSVPVGSPLPQAFISHVPKAYRTCEWKLVPEHGGAWKCVEGDAAGKNLLVTGNPTHGQSELVSLDGTAESGLPCQDPTLMDDWMGGGIAGTYYIQSNNPRSPIIAHVFQVTSWCSAGWTRATCLTRTPASY